MQNCLRWVRSHSRRRFPVAFAPYAPPSGSLVVVVAPWHWSGAPRSVLVSGLRPVMLCVPRPPLWASPLRGIGPALVCPSAPKGLPQPSAKYITLIQWKMQQALRACVAHMPHSECRANALCMAVTGRAGETATERQPETQSEPPRRKDLEHFYSKSLIHMVGVKGFEPSTPCTPCKCATRLRHTPI
jgi:hypothetical protein